MQLYNFLFVYTVIRDNDLEVKKITWFEVIIF